ncbi:uncharacterized protein LOC126838159 isoform X2 [Adelges cooleyi]|nr:uncharacterized protein LOC126838159 isoform X2 [Adelges cooleyi]
MEANSSDDIIDYIMLLVTIKKSSSELVKGLEFLLEENTSIFVKWLSTFIKKLQKVTVSTTKLNAHDDLQVHNEVNDLKTNYEILTSESNKDDLEKSNEEKDEFLLKLSADEADINSIERDTELKQDKKSDLISVEKSDELNYKHENTRVEISDIENIIKNKEKSATNVEIKKHVHIYQHESNKKPSLTNTNHYPIDCNQHNDSQSQQNVSDVNNTVEIKRKRPRISLDSDNEDNGSCKAVEKVVSNNTKLKYKPNPIKTGEPCQKVHRLASKVSVVNRMEPKFNNLEIKKKLYLHDLVTQKVDHQRGALALDTAFQYIQEQIGATDKDIAIVKKWRDYAVGMLRSNEKSVIK